jgi:hypothetical protein
MTPPWLWAQCSRLDVMVVNPRWRFASESQAGEIGSGASGYFLYLPRVSPTTNAIGMRTR